MKLFISLFALFISLGFQPAFAIDPGTVDGSFQINDEMISLRHAYAQLHDNAEGLLDTPKELRLLLCDREVMQNVLTGIAFLPVERMAREGLVQGLLLRFDPADLNSATVTILTRTTGPQQSLPTQTLSSTPGKIIEGFKIMNNRVGGRIDYRDKEQPSFEEIPKLNYSLRFSAPLFHEPAITTEFKGKTAGESPQANVCREKARALAKGDWAAVKRLSTEYAGRQLDLLLMQAGKDADSLLKPLAAEMEQSLKQVERVVVRRDRAVMILQNKQWLNFVQEGGVWKADD